MALGAALSLVAPGAGWADVGCIRAAGGGAGDGSMRPAGAALRPAPARGRVSGRQILQGHWPPRLRWGGLFMPVDRPTMAPHAHRTSSNRPLRLPPAREEGSARNSALYRHDTSKRARKAVKRPEAEPGTAAERPRIVTAKKAEVEALSAQRRETTTQGVTIASDFTARKSSRRPYRP